MTYRILRIRGRTAGAREARLNLVTRWMVQRGWQLVEYSESTRQAMFEPGSEQAGSLFPWHLPPGFWKGLLEDWSAPRRYLPLGVALLLIVSLFVINATQGEYDPQVAVRAQQALWRRVTVDTLNVRESPAAGAQIVGMVYKNQRVLIGEELEGWVELVEPQRGFVSSRFLERVAVDTSDSGAADSGADGGEE